MASATHEKEFLPHIMQVFQHSVPMGGSTSGAMAELHMQCIAMDRALYFWMGVTTNMAKLYLAFPPPVGNVWM